MEEMEKRSDRHIRDLVAHTAFKGLDANEIGCARISVMAGGQLLPSKGRIQMSKTNYLQAVISDLQRTASKPTSVALPFSLRIRPLLPDSIREPECDAAGRGTRGRHAELRSRILRSWQFRDWDLLRGNMECPRT